MKDYATDILARPLKSKKSEPEAPAEHDYAADILNRNLHPETQYEPTGGISTITGLPEEEFTGAAGPGASFEALRQASWVRKPSTKAALYAEARFPDLAPKDRLPRVGLKDGEVYLEMRNEK